MKPTPTTVAMLMSAAGLSLSLPAFAAAHGDANGRPDFVLTFGVAARHEEACQAPAFDGLAPCLVLDSVHVSATLREGTRAQSVAVAAKSRQAIDVEWSHPVFEAYSASLAARPNAPRALPPSREAVGAAQQSSHVADRDREADAIAMVLMEHPPDAPEIGHPTDGGLPHAGATQRGLADLATVAPTPPVDLTSEIAHTDPSSPTSIERVLNSLAEIAGSQTAAPAPSLGTAEVRRAMQTRDAVASVPTTQPEAATLAGLSASPMEAVDGHSSAIERLDAANEIVVANHGDRVLLNLAALRSDEEPTSGRFGAQAKKTVVASHSEKVLETLALFQQDKARKHVRRAVTGSPAKAPQGKRVSATTEADLSQSKQIAPVVADKSVEAVNSIHERHVLPRAQDAASLQARHESTSTDASVIQEPVRGSSVGSDVVAPSLDGDHVSAAMGEGTTAQSAALAAESPQPTDGERSQPVFESTSAILAASPNAPRAADPTQPPEVGLVLPAQVHRAAASPALSGPDDLPPSREAVAAAQQVDHVADRDREADAIAMVLMEHPPIRSQDTLVGASSAPGKLAGEPHEVVVSERRPILEPLVPHSPDERVMGLPSDIGLPYARAKQGGLADLATVAPAPPVHLTFEIAGSQTAAPAPSLGAAEVRTAMQTRDAVASVPAILPEAAIVADPSASPMDATDGYSSAIERLEAANDIVVATHGDRVLMSLAALRSDAEPTSGRFGAQTKKTVVASHSEKVLETLALFQQDKTRKHGRRAMTGSPARLSQGHHVSSTTESDLPQSTQIAPVVADESVETVDSIHERRVLPRAQDAASLQAKRDATRIDAPVTQESVRGNPIGSDVVALSTERLDEVRGGFVSEDGLKISFGIERAVYLNGSLVTTTSLNVADLSKISGGQAQVTTAGTGSLALVQSGQGNTFLPGSISQTAAGIVIQNSLDNQKIQTITRIDAVVNSSGIIRSMNLQSSMRSAIVDSLRR